MTGKEKQEFYKKIRDAVYKVALYEPNNEITRNKVVEAVTEIIQKYEDYDKIYEYVFVCDESENQKEIIESNNLRSTLIYRPRKEDKQIIKHFDINIDGN